jgi:putative Holliday junction resolvase
LTDVSKYLSIDYGAVRVGIAVTDEDKRFSFSRGYLLNDDRLLKNLLQLIKEEKISKIIIGLPLTLKSEKSAQTLKVQEFRDRLESFLKGNSVYPELVFFDERLSSSLAKTKLLQLELKRSKRREKGILDSISAQIILQDYLDKEINLKR